MIWHTECSISRMFALYLQFFMYLCGPSAPDHHQPQEPQSSSNTVQQISKLRVIQDILKTWIQSNLLRKLADNRETSVWGSTVIEPGWICSWSEVAFGYRTSWRSACQSGRVTVSWAGISAAAWRQTDRPAGRLTGALVNHTPTSWISLEKKNGHFPNVCLVKWK